MLKAFSHVLSLTLTAQQGLSQQVNVLLLQIKCSKVSQLLL